ncbi:MAG TPA: carboxypeptidase-like regulatory domain-containing protein [Terracidiphilus sp.]
MSEKSALKGIVLRGRPRQLLLSFILIVLSIGIAYGQADQGAITGTVIDSTGALVPNAQITLTAVDTGLVLHTSTDASGVYIFAPIKIGNYSITAEAGGFEKTTQQNVHLDVQQRLAVVITMKTGAATETVTVTDAPPLMQTEEGSTGQVIESQAINETPLNGRNWVFIAQLTAGVDPPSGSRGAGNGDFNANGQRAEQNNFILDGVDNNNNVVDFLNGASFIVRPPPDALAEFKIQTGAYSAEFGHSAGAVVNASLKAGTNQIHGDLWEYNRNDAYDIRQEFQGSNPVPKYRENQFGATLGLPIFRNKLFFFGDAEANRIVFGESHTNLTVPTALMRTGDFSELLNGANNSSGLPVVLYEPNTSANGTTVMPNNTLTPGQIDPLAQSLLNMYPMPSPGLEHQTYNNFDTQSNVTDNTFQWDTRIDYNASSKDQIFARFSYSHELAFHAPPLGPILDGGSFGDSGNVLALGENFALSETHVFAPTLSNEFRFGYNYGHFGYHQVNSNTDISSKLGLGGIPFAPLNGGIPYVTISGYSQFGSPQFYVSDEHNNVFEILDNVLKSKGNHALKAGVSFQKIRFATEQPTNPRGNYNYTGVYTSKVGTTNTGFGGADFLLDDMNSAGISNLFTTDDARWDRAAYFQDDWKVSQKLTMNLGIRWEYAQPYYDRHGHQAMFYPTSTTLGSASGIYLIPKQSAGVALSPVFTNLLAKDNITIKYSSNPSLVDSQKTNFAPRIGFAFRPTDRAVLRGGYGIFFGGLESTGYYPNLGENYPFEFDSSFPTPTGCVQGGACPTNGFTLETGFSAAIAAGLQNAISKPTLRGSEPTARTPYSEQYNLALEYGVSSNMTAAASYVGSVGRHLQIFPNPNGQQALAPNGYGPNPNPLQAFPDFGGLSFTAYDGVSSYNSLQTKLERRFSKNLSFLASYTWSHSLDDAPTPLGSTGDGGYRNTALVPIGLDYSNSPFDVRHRVTFNTNYQLPFGIGRTYANSNKLLDILVGGWSSSLVFRAQTGEPFTVYSSNITNPAGASARAIRIADPFKGGGTPDPSYSGSSAFTCPTKVRTIHNWYNPCSFRNPQASTLTYNANGSPQTVSGVAALAYLGASRNQVSSAGYGRVDQSLFKSFKTFHEENLEFRADVFNLLNTPAYGESSNTGVGAQGGQISGLRFFQNNTPDSRFFQFALKYNF